MKLFALVFVVTLATGAPQLDTEQQYVSSGQPEIRILSQKLELDPVGNYEYSYEQDNGQKVQEAGRVQPGPEPETGSIEQQGYYEYIGDDGNTYRVDYTANEAIGFQAQGAHLPQAPAQIPEYAQLRRDYPQLFWAENGGAGVVLSNQQYDNQQFIQSQQFDDQQFDNQQFDNQQFDNQQFDSQQFNNQQIDNQQFIQSQQFDNQQQLGNQQFDNQQFDNQQFDNQQFDNQQYDNQQFDNQQIDNQQFIQSRQFENQQQSVQPQLKSQDQVPLLII